MVALRMILAALIPVILAVVFFTLQKKTKFGSIKYIYRQIIIGVAYGIVACLATQYGVPYEKYMMNVRSASPLTAGLIFGAPAGIIAGVIGAVYRFISVLWGISKYTQIACSVATLLAGLIGAGCNKYIFNGKRPSCIYCAVIAAITETFHMLLVFITHMNDIKTAFSVVQETAIIMICANAASLFVTSFIIIFIAREPVFFEKKDRTIVKPFSLYLLVSVLICFILTSSFTYFLQDNVSNYEVKQTLSLNIIDMETAVDETVDAEIVANLDKIAIAVNNGIKNSSTPYKPSDMSMQSWCKTGSTYDVSEIIYVSSEGLVLTSYYEGPNTRYQAGDAIADDDILSLFNQLFDEKSNGYYVTNLQPTTKLDSNLMKYAGTLVSNNCILIIGYNEARYNDFYCDAISNVATNRHIGQSGYMFVLSSADDSVISAPSKEKKSIAENASSFAEGLAALPDDTVLTYNVPNSEEFFYMKDTINGYLVVACLPVSEVDFSRNISVYIGLFMQIFVFFILFILIFILLKKIIVGNVDKVNGSLALITNGDLETIVDAHDNAEFSSLSDGINATVTRLKGYIDDEKKRIDMELQFAKSIQLSVIPSMFPPYPNRTEFDIYAMMDTAKEVGGDFYDFYLLDGTHLAFLMADVSGKGIPAAMFMMNAKSIIKALAESGLPIDEIMAKANEKLCASNEAGMFVTAWMGILDLGTGVIKYVNAGHNPPLIKKKAGEFEYIKGRHCFILAGMEDAKYKVSELSIEPGDEIFLYTDGATEANNKENELYGEKRLKTILDATKCTSAKSLCDAVKSDIDSFVGNAPQFDDITMLSLKYLSKTKPQGDTRMIKELSIEASINNIDTVTEFVDAELLNINCNKKAMMQINVAIDELFSNIAHYAYNPDKGNATVQIEVINDPMSVVITFVDEGIPFDPLSRENPDITQSAEERDIGGLGIFMVKQTMDAVRYEYKDNKNILTIVKNL